MHNWGGRRIASLNWVRSSLWLISVRLGCHHQRLLSSDEVPRPAKRLSIRRQHIASSQPQAAVAAMVAPSSTRSHLVATSEGCGAAQLCDFASERKQNANPLQTTFRVLTDCCRAEYPNILHQKVVCLANRRYLTDSHARTDRGCTQESVIRCMECRLATESCFTCPMHTPVRQTARAYAAAVRLLLTGRRPTASRTTATAHPSVTLFAAGRSPACRSQSGFRYEALVSSSNPASSLQLAAK